MSHRCLVPQTGTSTSDMVHNESGKLQHQQDLPMQISEQLPSVQSHKFPKHFVYCIEPVRTAKLVQVKSEKC